MRHRTANGIKRHRNFRPGSYNSRLRTNGRASPFQPQGPTYEQAIAIARGSAQAVQEGQTRFYQNPFARAAAAAFMAASLYGCSDSGHTVYAAGLEDNRPQVVAAEADEDPTPEPEEDDFTIDDAVTDADGKPAVTPVKIIEVSIPGYTPEVDAQPEQPKPEVDAQSDTQPNGDYKPTSKQSADESKPVEQPKAEQEPKPVEQPKPKDDTKPEDVIAPLSADQPQPNADYDPTTPSKDDASAPAGTPGSDPNKPKDDTTLGDVLVDVSDQSPKDDTTLGDVLVDVSDQSPKDDTTPGDVLVDVSDQSPKDATTPAVSVDAPKPPKEPFKSQARLRPYDGPHTHRPITIVEGRFHLDPKTEGSSFTIVDNGGEDSAGVVMRKRTRFALHGDKSRFRTEVNGGDKYKTETLVGYVGADLGAVDVEANFETDVLERNRTEVTQDTTGGIDTTTTTDDEENIDTTNYGAKIGVAVGPVRIYVRGRRETKRNKLGTTTVEDIVNPPNGNIIITTDVETEQERTRDIGVLEIGGLVNPQSFVGGYFSVDDLNIGALEQSINGTSVPTSIPEQDYLRFGFGLSLDHMLLDSNGKPIGAFGIVGGSQWLDTEDDTLQGLEGGKAAVYAIFRTHPHALLYFNATHTGDALDFDRDILADRTQFNANLGFVIGKDAAQYIQVLRDTFSLLGRDAMGINANSPGNIALNQQILSNLATYTLGIDDAGLSNLVFLVQGGPVLSEEGGQEYKGRQVNAVLWAPFNKGDGGVGVEFNRHGNGHSFESRGGRLLYRYNNHGAYIKVDQVKDSRFGEEQKRKEISFGYVVKF